MTFKPAIWRPIAIGLSAINLLAGGFAAGQGEPWHATAHVALALAFGYWAARLRLRSGDSGRQADLEALEEEMGELRRELGEAQERLDFAERLMAQRPESLRVEREHGEP